MTEKLRVVVDHRRQRGAEAERLAVELLQAQQIEILHCNWRCRSGELDIIARDGGCLVFVEVRSRSGAQRNGTAAEAFDARKIQQVRRTAQVYIYQQQQFDVPTRFDAIAVTFQKDGTYDVKWYQHAF
ncbi:YraN family protein [Paenibacillus sp. 481]|uniref:YraN family protein n=1 Tax=Paenibacillus sp. 481 TaxID=2835869 RepID=UPI001E2DD2FF|nr:YraN family protein [Paenibacillus sp. 481]UHA73953.1 YraN family protein [Paenibacillus sp. 481]